MCPSVVSHWSEISLYGRTFLPTFVNYFWAGEPNSEIALYLGGLVSSIIQTWLHTVLTKKKGKLRQAKRFTSLHALSLVWAPHVMFWFRAQANLTRKRTQTRGIFCSSLLLYTRFNSIFSCRYLANVRKLLHQILEERTEKTRAYWDAVWPCRLTNTVPSH